MNMAYEFDAPIKTPKDKPGAYVEVPYDLRKEFGKGRLNVKASFDGEPVRGSIVSMGGIYVLGIQKAIQIKIGKKPGDTIHVRFKEDTQPRIVEVPPDLRAALEKEDVWSIFEHLSYSHKREYAGYVTDAKKEETRRNHIDKTVKMLKGKMKK